MVSPSVTETTLAGQEKQVAGMASRRKRKVRWEAKNRAVHAGLPSIVLEPLVLLLQRDGESNPGKFTYSFVID